MTILVNDVRRIRSAGARESTVKRRKICKTTATSSGLPVLSKPMFRNGREEGVPAPRQTWLPAQTKSRVIPETINNLNGLITTLLHQAMIGLFPEKFFPSVFAATYFCCILPIVSVNNPEMNPISFPLLIRRTFPISHRLLSWQGG